MEIAIATKSAKFDIFEQSHIGDTRRRTSALTKSILDNESVSQLELVITELATNLVKHATEGGYLLINAIETDVAGYVDVVCIDEGPGIADIEAMMMDGASTTRTAGTGLGAIKRLSSEFSIASSQKGTTVAARIYNKNEEALNLDFTGLCLPHPDEKVCGDGWAIAVTDNSYSMCMVDGLGHGSRAAEATDEALKVFRKSPFAEPKDLLQTMNVALRSTRGAAVMLVQLDPKNKRLRYSGVGNIYAQLSKAGRKEGLLSHRGIVGYKMPKPHTVEVSVEKEDQLLLCSDGIIGHELQKEDEQNAITAARLFRDHLRGEDDASTIVCSCVSKRK